ncbi:MAG: hypothetical protein MZV70_12115 [Desulfobacterales bacterium]|nr:hypothetical protein [Desulfobacterales bacterium]
MRYPKEIVLKDGTEVLIRPACKQRMNRLLRRLLQPGFRRRTAGSCGLMSWTRRSSAAG